MNEFFKPWMRVAIGEALLAWIAAFLIATGFAMVRFDEFVAARVLFWLAVVIFALQQFAWQLVTTTPWWFRLPAGALTGIAVFVVFPILVG